MRCADVVVVEKEEDVAPDVEVERAAAGGARGTMTGKSCILFLGCEDICHWRLHILA